MLERIRRPATRSLAGGCVAFWLATGAAECALAGFGNAGAALDLHTFVIVDQSPIDPATTRLEFTGTIENSDGGSFASNAIFWSWQGYPDYPGVTTIDDRFDYPFLGPHQSAPLLDNLILAVPNAVLPTLLADLAAGDDPFVVTAVEWVIYTPQVRLMDGPTADLLLDSAFPPFPSACGTTTGVMAFDMTTPFLDALVPGHILVCDYNNPTNGCDGAAARAPLGGAWPGFDACLPVIVTLIDRGGGDDVFVEFTRVDDPTDVIASGAFGFAAHLARDPESTVPLDGTPDLGGCPPMTENCPLLPPLPIRFNAHELAPGLEVSGEILFRSLDIGLELEFRNAQISRAALLADMGYSSTITLEALQNLTASLGEAEIGGSGTSWKISVFGVDVYLQASVRLDLGAEATLSSGSVLSGHHGANARIAIGSDEGQVLFDPETTILPLAFSTPELNNDAGGTAQIWSELGFKVAVCPLIPCDPFGSGPGATFTSRGFADFAIEPFESPWWRSGTGLEQEAGFEISIFGFEVAPTPTQLWDTYFPGPTAPPGRTVPQRSGDGVRWGKAVSELGGNGVHGESQVARLADGSLLLTSYDTSDGYLVKLDAQGGFVWARRIASAAFPVRGFELPGGDLLIAGNQGSKIWIARHEADGDRLWAKAYTQAPSCMLQDAGLLEEEGIFYLVAVGTGRFGWNGSCVFKFEDDGDPVWAKSYGASGTDFFQALAITADDGIALAGETDASAGSDPQNNGLVAKLEADGTVEYAQAIGSKWGLVFEAIAEGEGGALYFGGGLNGVEGDGYPSLFVGSLHGGSSLNQVLIERDAAWEGALSWLDNSTATPQGEHYDRVFDIAPHAGGFLLVGKTGEVPDQSDTAAWALQVTDKLGVAWMSAFSGPAREQFHALADTGDGFVAVGPQQSFSAEPGIFALKLPYEGILRFDPGVSGLSRFLQPKTYPSGLNEDDFTGAFPVSFTVADVTLTAATAPPAPLVVTPVLTPLATPHLGFVPDLIFADDLESGNTSAWSNGTP